MGKKIFFGSIILTVILAWILTIMLPRPGGDGQFEWTMNLGRNYLDQGESAKAVGVFTKAVAVNPVHPDGRLNLANALLLNDQPDLALEQAREASLLERNSAAAYFVAGCALNRLRRFEEAVQSLHLSINLDSTVAATFFQLGRAHFDLGQFEEAVADFQECIRLEPGHVSAHYQLSQSLLRLNRDAEAAVELAAHQKILAGLPQKPVTAATFERSKHTQARVPFTLDQPDARGITITFTDGTAAMLGTNAVGWSGPVGVIDVSHDGRPGLFVCEGDGFRLLGGVGASLAPRGSLLPGVSGAKYRRCLVGDLQNDGVDDVVVLGDKASRVFRFTTNGVATEVSALAGLKELTALDGALADLDFSGKLDLLVVTTNHAVQVFRNLGDGFFKDNTLAAGAGTLNAVEQVVVDDWNNDSVGDLLAARTEMPPALLTKMRGGSLSSTNAPDNWPSGSLIAVGDLNNDSRNDLVVVGPDRIDCVLGHLNQRQTLPTGGRPINHVYLVDYDNDGWLDILTCGMGVRLWRNYGAAGFHEVTSAVGLDKWSNVAVESVALADFDNDCDTDLIFCVEHGGLLFARNDGGNANAQLKIMPRGTRSNASALGVRLDVAAGGLRSSRTIRQSPVEIGLGRYKQADSLVANWFDTRLSSVDVKADCTPLRLVELQFPAGSCPYLYAWDGKKFRFVSDFQCASPLGLPVSESRLVEADPDEYLWLGDDGQFPARDGLHVVQVTEELREVLYLDQARLFAVDHPAGTVVLPTSKLHMGKPFPPHELVVLEAPRLIRQATRSDGLDVTAALSRVDGQMVSPVRLRVPQLRGLAKPYTVTMDFGPLAVQKPLVLALTGWLRFGGGMGNIAASHDPGLPFPFPVLEAETADGQWRRVEVEVGAPSGKTKTIIVDLAGKLPPGTGRLRLGTAFEIHWDAAVMYDRVAQPAVRFTELAARKADLHRRGFSDYEDLPWTQPLTPIYDRVRPDSRWRITPSGWATRYGDVRELVSGRDDTMALVAGGDELTLGFAASELPGRPAGQVRDFFIFTSGWDKDADFHVRFGETIGPFPFHGMDDQRYGFEARPVRPNDAWMKKYNTRWIGPETLVRNDPGQ